MAIASSFPMAVAAAAAADSSSLTRMKKRLRRRLRQACFLFLPAEYFVDQTSRY